MTMYIIIYLIGYVLAYYRLRYFSEKHRNENNRVGNYCKDDFHFNKRDWDDVGFDAICSILSWLILLISLVSFIFRKFPNVKTPKWL